MDNFNTNWIEIKDENIKFEEKTEEKVEKNNKILIIKGKLSYEIKECPCCKKEEKIIKNGYRTTKIKLPKILDQDTELYLKKQRYKCKECNSTFTADTKIVDKYCNISNKTKIGILLKLQEKESFKQISENYNLSSASVIRIMKTNYKLVDNNKFNNLPEHLSFDEIKSTKDAYYAMSFVYSDAKKNKLIDIVNGRTYYSLQKHFSRYAKSVRNKVKTICIDIYPPYMKIIKEFFPKADIIIDRFHIVQNIMREFNKTRIKVMNSYKKTSPKLYRILKKYYKLLMIREDKINHEIMERSKIFDRYISNGEILKFMLNISDELARDYRVMQDTLWAIHTRDVSLFEVVINRNTDYSQGINKAIKTMRKYKQYMLNSLKYEFSNGPLEALNNKIKVVKRVSYGFRNFYNFKLRTLFVLKSFAFNHDNYNDKNILMRKNNVA